MAHVFFILPKFQSSKIYIFLPSLVKKSRFTTKNRNLGRARVKSSFYTSGFKGGTILVAFWRKTGHVFRHSLRTRCTPRKREIREIQDYPRDLNPRESGVGHAVVIWNGSRTRLRYSEERPVRAGNKLLVALVSGRDLPSTEFQFKLKIPRREKAGQTSTTRTAVNARRQPRAELERSREILLRTRILIQDSSRILNSSYILFFLSTDRT